MGIYLLFIGAVLAALGAIIDKFSTLSVKIIDTHGRKRRRITLTGKIYIVFVILSCLIGIKEISDKNEKSNNQSTIILRDTLPPIIKHDTTKSEIVYKASLDLCVPNAVQQNPMLKPIPDGRNGLSVTIFVCNFGNDDAINIEDKSIPITYKDGKPIFTILHTIPTTNPTTTIHYKQSDIFDSQYFHFNVVRQDGEKIKYENPFFFYFNIKYTNTLGHRMKPIEKIFSIDSSGISEPNSEVYARVKKDLKSEKLW